MEGASNTLAVLNGASNNYDRAICFDAPVQMDTGLYAYESKTRAQVRAAIISVLGFVDPLTYTSTRTLAQLRADIATRLGWAAQVAAGSYPQGSLPLLDSFINEAQQDIFRRLDIDNEDVTPPTRMEDAADVTSIDYVPVFNLALALAKAHYGQPDHKVYFGMVEQYIGDVARKRPPKLTSTINELIASAQEQLYFRYDMLRTERWWAWQTTAGRRMYDVPIDCTKALDFRKITGAWLSDNGGRAYVAWAANTAYTLGQYVLPSEPRGWDHVVSTAGTSGATEPDWAEDDFSTADGTVVYTRVAQAAARYMPLRQGINPLDFSVSQEGMPYRFDLREYLEVWPTPDKAYVIWLKGHLGIRELSEDTHTLTVDYQPVFLMALANAKEQYKQPAASYWRQLEVLIGKYAAATHGIRRYIPNPAPITDQSVMWGDCPPCPLPRATWR